MQRLAELVKRAAKLRVAVLLLGESGTGKELVARALHAQSPRAERPMVVLNGATVSPELAASELFGHRRGAFTGAQTDRLGAFRSARGGTLFIDEVAALPATVQAKLLRAVEEGLVLPVGSDQPEPVDVRLITATCEPLEDLVGQRRFRLDLYQRLATCVIRVPALRERAEDIAALARHLLDRSDLAAYWLGPAVAAALQDQPWPGNVRELGNVLVQAALRASDEQIELGDVLSVLCERAPYQCRRLSGDEARTVLVDHGGNVSAAARRARMPRSTFRDLLRAADPHARPRQRRSSEGGEAP